MPGLPRGSVTKILLADAGDARELAWSSGSGRSLEEEMAICSSTLAWKIPWTEDPGGLQSVGSQRAGHKQGG